MTNELSLGEYIRRLRRSAKKSLHSVSETTGISYSHLSRIENDSTVPNAESVAKIAEALDGDLRTMLEKANCLPRSILDRITARDNGRAAGALRRAAFQSDASETRATEALQAIVSAGVTLGLTPEEAHDLASAMQCLTQMASGQRQGITSMIHSLFEEGDDKPT